MLPALQRARLLLALLAIPLACNAPAARPTRANSDGTSKTLPPGPPGHSPTTVVLTYQDFGPQVMAIDLLGNEWWQWEAGGSFEADDEFDVRVVVYRGIPLAKVQAEYPTVRARADYRYVAYNDALAYLDAQIKDLETDPTPPFDTLLARLRQTRQSIIDALPVK